MQYSLQFLNHERRMLLSIIIGSYFRTICFLTIWFSEDELCRRKDFKCYFNASRPGSWNTSFDELNGDNVRALLEHCYSISFYLCDEY